ncbi:MAG: glycosyltransferase [Proteobacteria bacterium]|nr:glycosyltransferase [Pseudomonadota bacterium]NIS72759.1 glycosyltransferase [Pseudomonadota bacterium]
MRVGLVIYGSLDSMSGGYLYDRKLLEHLETEGDQVEVFSIPWRSYPRHLLDNLSSQWLNQLVRADLDLLLQDELNHPSLFWINRRLRPRTPYPIISIVHHLRSCECWAPPLSPLYRVVERRYLKSVDALVFNSQSTRLSVIDLLGCAGSGVIAYPGGDRLDPAMDEGAILARANRSGPLRLAFVGNLIPRKGLHGLLAALADLKHESWELWVIGCTRRDSAYTKRIRGIIANAGLGGRVQLLGSVSDAELARLLRSSDAIAMPFSYEGFGIVYLEGMAYGLPALASNTGGAREIVAHGESGYLIDPGDLRRVTRLVRHLMVDRGELSRMSLAARRRFEAFPTWEQTTTKIRNFLLEMVQSVGRDS